MLAGLLISHVGARVNGRSGRCVRTREDEWNRERSLRGSRLTKEIASFRSLSLRSVLLSTLTAVPTVTSYSSDSRWTDDRKIVLPHRSRAIPLPKSHRLLH